MWSILGKVISQGSTAIGVQTMEGSIVEKVKKEIWFSKVNVCSSNVLLCVKNKNPLQQE